MTDLDVYPTDLEVRVGLALASVLGHTTLGDEPAPNTRRLARELLNVLEREHGLHVMEAPIG